MANVVKMAVREAIVGLLDRGWSQRRIARELGVHRETVARYAGLAHKEEAAPAKAPPGPDGPSDPKPAKAPPGLDGPSDSKPAKAPPGIARSRSACEPFRTVILEKVELGLSAQRIYQDLVTDHAFRASYTSVKRFVGKLRTVSPLPFRRMESEPGAEAQIDFGRGAPVVDPDTGKRRVPHVFRIVLSFSRKGYSEAVWRQRTETFIRVLENALHHFGGSVRTLVPDNLRAAVTKADWYDPEINPKVQDFCRHYGTVLLPTKPRMPRHKGKIERGIAYVRQNALKGHTFKSLAEQNRHLLDWEEHVADHRIHGTTRKQVAEQFYRYERPALQALPITRFPFFHEAPRSVHRDGHIEVAKAYYSVPPEYVSRQVWARWDGRVVRVFNQRFEQIAIHGQREPGRFSTDPQHIAAEKISNVERGAEYLLRRAHLLGFHTGQWAEAMLMARGIQGIRVLQGLLSMAGKHPVQAIDNACELALTHGAYRLRTLRRLMKQPTRQEQLDFIEAHPLIREMEEYGQMVTGIFREKEDT